MGAKEAESGREMDGTVTLACPSRATIYCDKGCLRGLLHPPYVDGRGPTGWKVPARSTLKLLIIFVIKSIMPRYTTCRDTLDPPIPENVA
jgi:hypothetical protein